MESLTDEQLMLLVGNKNNGRGMHALDHLYKRYSKPMLNFFYFTLHNDTARAEDFVHDLFLKILDNSHRFDAQYYFKAWIYRMAANMCKNEFRSKLVGDKYSKHIISTTDEIETHTTAPNEAQKEIYQVISDMEQEHRALIVLRFKMNLSIKEMAQIYECPEGTVKSRLFYATKELSKRVKNNEL